MATPYDDRKQGPACRAKRAAGPYHVTQQPIAIGWPCRCLEIEEAARRAVLALSFTAMTILMDA